MSKALEYAFIAAAAAAAFIIGILIGVYGVVDPPGSAYKNKIDISEILHDEIKAEKIAENLRTLISVPHLAGTPQDLEQANWMKDRFLEAGLDEAKVVAYEVLLSYPDFDNPNKVHLLDDTGSILFTTSGRQVPLQDRGEFSPLVVPNFNAYSASGEVQGDLVYAYYGRDEDFDVLAARGISVSGKIVLARYGAIYRGNIAKNAEKRGAIGVLLFSDPQNFALSGRNSTYPHNWWMPGMAVQSGTILAEKGDPLTPRYPSIESAYRIPEGQANLPKIPVQPIGYDEAEHFLRSLSTSNLAPTEWQGGLNATYYLGPLVNGREVYMNITTRNKRVKTYNAIGFLYGEEEPDRYVILGNHRDAWVLGAVDPSSGTASMVELARAFGAVKKQHNWRPRRTLVFCSWGAEEYGLIGSYEWVEEHAKVLAQRAIAYINVDISVEGNYSLRANSVPMLRSVIVDAAKKVRNPHPSEISAGRTTVYDSWIRRMPDVENPNTPE